MMKKKLKQKKTGISFTESSIENMACIIDKALNEIVLQANANETEVWQRACWLAEYPVTQRRLNLLYDIYKGALQKLLSENELVLESVLYYDNKKKLS